MIVFDLCFLIYTDVFDSSVSHVGQDGNQFTEGRSVIRILFPALSHHSVAKNEIEQKFSQLKSVCCSDFRPGNKTSRRKVCETRTLGHLCTKSIICTSFKTGAKHGLLTSHVHLVISWHLDVKSNSRCLINNIFVIRMQFVYEITLLGILCT